MSFSFRATIDNERQVVSADFLLPPRYHGTGRLCLLEVCLLLTSRRQRILRPHSTAEKTFLSPRPELLNFGQQKPSNHFGPMLDRMQNVLVTKQETQTIEFSYHIEKPFPPLAVFFFFFRPHFFNKQKILFTHKTIISHASSQMGRCEKIWQMWNIFFHWCHTSVCIEPTKRIVTVLFGGSQMYYMLFYL